MKLYVGIDPGLDGAIAVLDERGRILSVQDMPVLVKKGKGKKRLYEETVLLSQLESVRKLFEETPDAEMTVAIENQHAMPKNGSVGGFSQGYGFGLLIMALTALGLSYTKVSSVSWKKALAIPAGSDKTADLVRARQLWPKAELARQKDNGRADALLIAEFARRVDRG